MWKPAIISSPLPHKELCYLSAKEIKPLDIIQILDDNDTGYILEVDLHYPRVHNNFSYSQQHLSHSLKTKKPPNLITNLLDKNKHEIHYVFLKPPLDSGLKLIQIQSIIKFRQSNSLQTDINLNNDMRKISTNDFEKNFFKLMYIFAS